MASRTKAKGKSFAIPNEDVGIDEEVSNEWGELVDLIVTPDALNPKEEQHSEKVLNLKPSQAHDEMVKAGFKIGNIDYSYLWNLQLFRTFIDTTSEKMNLIEKWCKNITHAF